ncbi:MAG: Nif3-like dinuclear metal center hexameric protein, partial [Spirochaetaceae bacterium]|nr:Nif3-like dinuclear metal center hexameric protein [Spirochaetaceae bacterium]
MTTTDIDAYFRRLLKIEDWASCDSALNGLQVDNSGVPVCKIAFAVDASLETFERANAIGAGMLFVHHGLYWGHQIALTGNFRRRIKYLFDHDIALYAAHLPLDQHPELGNNAVLAEKLGMTALEPFGVYHGRTIGYKGTLTAPLTLDQAGERIAYKSRPAVALLPFGKNINTTCAVVSGGAAKEVEQALAEGVDLYITGESAHSIYHTVMEGKLNMLCGGHYATEVWGPQKLAE